MMTRLTMVLVSAMVTSLVGLGSSPAVAAVSPEAGAGDQQTTRIKYPGGGIDVWRKSGKERRLKGTPRTFRSFVRERLDQLFDDVGRRQKCARSPLVTVRRYHGAGFASFAEGTYRACPQGGYAGIYVRTPDGWSAPLAGHEAPYCSDLEWYRVPRFIAGRECYTEGGESATYRLGAFERVSPPAVGRRLESALRGLVIVATDQLASADVVAELTGVVDAGGYVSLVECVTAGDGSHGSGFLEDAPYGCVLRASYDSNTFAEDRILRMYPGADGAITVGSVELIGSS